MEHINPGRKLDILIAKEIFGTEVIHLNQRGGHRIDYVAANNEYNNPIISMDMVDGWRLKRYSTNIEDAWEIVEKLGKQGVQWRFSNKAFSNTYWWAYTEDVMGVQGETIMHAICLAALQHMRENKT